LPFLFFFIFSGESKGGNGDNCRKMGFGTQKRDKKHDGMAFFPIFVPFFSQPTTFFSQRHFVFRDFTTIFLYVPIL